MPEDDREEKPEHRTLNMDGTLHEVPGAPVRCCAQFAKQCSECGGYAHYQPVYGGHYYECEDCGHSWC